MAKTVVGFFDTYDEAQAAYDELVRRGFEPGQITLITNRQTYCGNDAVGGSQTEPTSAAIGAATGAIVGGSAGLIASLIPGVGPVLAVGPLLATLFGTGVGAVAGGIIGTLVDVGVPEEDARLYQEGVCRGGSLLILHANTAAMAQRAASVMNQFGAEDIKRRGEQWQTEMKSDTKTQPIAEDAGQKAD